MAFGNEGALERVDLEKMKEARGEWNGIQLQLLKNHRKQIADQRQNVRMMKMNLLWLFGCWKYHTLKQTDLALSFICQNQ